MYATCRDLFFVLFMRVATALRKSSSIREYRTNDGELTRGVWREVKVGGWSEKNGGRLVPKIGGRLAQNIGGRWEIGF